MSDFCGNMDRTVSKSEAWALLCNELYGDNRLPTAKTAEVASDAFKAGVFATNTIATIQYGLILPLKEMTVGLTEDQAVYLDVYRKHTALCSAIEKVQSSYWKYTYAQTDVNEAGNVSERTGARKRAFTAGNELVEKHDNLIQLAIKQANDIDFRSDDRTAYLEGLHEKLDGKTRGYIYNTVNMIRAKAGIEANLQNTDTADLKKEYLKFATAFVSNVREARLKSGNSSVLDDDTDPSIPITKAFILGLAAIPELEKDFTLIELYDELTRHQSSKMITETQNDVIQYFQKQIEDLMNGSRWHLMHADLQKIQYQGISLSSVLESISVKQLEELYDLGKDLQKYQKWVQDIEAKIQKLRQSIAESVEYNFYDVHHFLHTLKKEALADIQEDGNALSLVVKSYIEALKTYADLTKTITDTTESQEKAKTARTNQIDSNKAQLEALNKQIADLKQDITKTNSEIDDKRIALQTLQEEIAAEKKKQADEKCSETVKKLKIAGFEKTSNDLVETRGGEIIELLRVLGDMQKAYSVQQEKITNLAEAQGELIKADGIQDEQDVNALQDLRKQRKVLETRPIAKLTGEQIKALAASSFCSTSSRIFGRLNDVLDAEPKIVGLTKDLSEVQRSAKNTQIKMEDISPHLKLNDGQAFVLDVAIFGDKEKTEIAAQLESNLVRAKQVTMSVVEKIVKLQGKAFETVLALAQRNAKEPLPHVLIERASVHRESNLQRALMIRKQRDENGNDSHALVPERQVVQEDENNLVLDDEI